MDHMKMNFEYFEIQKWELQTVRAEKGDEKDGVISLASMFPSWVMVLKLFKKSAFFAINLIKKPKSVKAFYMYASESSNYTLSENDIINRCLTHRSWNISD